jgi:hypothetical protein
MVHVCRSSLQHALQVGSAGYSLQLQQLSVLLLSHEEQRMSRLCMVSCGGASVNYSPEQMELV